MRVHSSFFGPFDECCFGFAFFAFSHDGSRQFARSHSSEVVDDEYR